jgi:hypothetical protein
MSRIAVAAISMDRHCDSRIAEVAEVPIHAPPAVLSRRRLAGTQPRRYGLQLSQNIGNTTQIDSRAGLDTKIGIHQTDVSLLLVPNRGIA